MIGAPRLFGLLGIFLDFYFFIFLFLDFLFSFLSCVSLCIQLVYLGGTFFSVFSNVTYQKNKFH